jgi:2-oxoglutarate/2-oxoacid ferredoxin oxidoreductase subunit beta
MSTVISPKNTNSFGLTRADYKGFNSTLCTGCGHDSITTQLINALYQLEVSPYDIAKLSGIGCASKTPAYFLNQSHGFNSIHGRMAPIATGVHLANSKLKLIGISGDGDTASIGLGGFVHMVRRNVPILYIMANNGVYGLTKGQFSATATEDHMSKIGEHPNTKPIDICRMALDLGCGFVARGFSGDTKQMNAILSAALRFNGTAVIDVISPCVTYANHEGSTKSYDFAKLHLSPYQEVEFLTHDQIQEIDPKDGEVSEITWPDGSVLRLKKSKHDVVDQPIDDTIKALREAENEGQILTGIFSMNTKKPVLNEKINSNDQLYTLQESDLKIPKTKFEELMKGFA